MLPHSGSPRQAVNDLNEGMERTRVHAETFLSRVILRNEATKNLGFCGASGDSSLRSE
jgi:hypothetical protein